MTAAILRLCAFGGCPELVTKGRCDAHRKEMSRERARTVGTAWRQGYNTEWNKVRTLALRRDNYLCQDCLLKDDRMVPATEVDHIIPFGGDLKSPLRLRLSNLRSLCTPHHSQKTATENGGFGRAKKG